jgi:hypothetical protein
MKETNKSNLIFLIALAVLVILLMTTMVYAYHIVDQKEELKRVKLERDSVINENTQLKIDKNRLNDVILGICDNH